MGDSLLKLGLVELFMFTHMTEHLLETWTVGLKMKGPAPAFSLGDRQVK